MTIRGGVRRSVDPLLNELVVTINTHFDEQNRVLVLGALPVGDAIALRFLASRATEWVTVHVQHNGTGGAGEEYDSTGAFSRQRIDCRLNRQQDVAIYRYETGGTIWGDDVWGDDVWGDDVWGSIATGDVLTDQFYVWLIPEFVQGDRTTVTQFDGVDGEDHMAFAALGNASLSGDEITVTIDQDQQMEEMLCSFDNMNEKLERLLAQMATITGLTIEAGEK